MKKYNPHNKLKYISCRLTENERARMDALIDDYKRKGVHVTRSKILRSMVAHCLDNPFPLAKEYRGKWAEIDEAVDHLGLGKVFEFTNRAEAVKCQIHIRDKYALRCELKKGVGVAYKTRDELKQEPIYKVIVTERE